MYTTITVKVYCTDSKIDVKTKLNNKKMNKKGPILKTTKKYNKITLSNSPKIEYNN